MEKKCFYHVVTDRQMTLGQEIVFDENHHSGVYNRVMEKLNEVKDVYLNPNKYKGQKLEHHLSVALRELALEKVRIKSFPNYPSRMSCLYVSREFEEAEKWAGLFIQLGRPTYSIVKLEVEGNVFIGDANNCFDGSIYEEENLKLAERYWKDLPNLKNENKISEVLVDGKIKVVEIVKEFNKNLEKN